MTSKAKPTHSAPTLKLLKQQSGEECEPAPLVPPMLEVLGHPGTVLLNAHSWLPRFWSTVWSFGRERQLAASTLRSNLRGVSDFYVFCDVRYGAQTLDNCISRRDARDAGDKLDSFRTSILVTRNYTTTTIQRWNAACDFIRFFAERFVIDDDKWWDVIAYIKGARLRTPDYGKPKPVRSLPETVIRDLLEVANPKSDRNPFARHSTRSTIWLVLHIFLFCGLRRGELLLLTLDSFNRGFDRKLQRERYWLNVTEPIESTDVRHSKPSLKTSASTRQVPISRELYDLNEEYINDHRHKNDLHPFLFTARGGAPTSAESIGKAFRNLSSVLSNDAKKLLVVQRNGKKFGVSPHDLRHTCATEQFRADMRANPDREHALARLRSFFGWMPRSDMPELYAKAAIDADLADEWRSEFEERTTRLVLRKDSR